MAIDWNEVTAGIRGSRDRGFLESLLNLIREQLTAMGIPEERQGRPQAFTKASILNARNGAPADPIPEKSAPAPVISLAELQAKADEMRERMKATASASKAIEVPEPKPKASSAKTGIDPAMLPDPIRRLIAEESAMRQG